MAATDTALRATLTNARVIAVVGLSENPTRDSYQIAQYLQSQGYRIVPVNPTVAEVLGEKAYPTLAAIPAGVHVDIADLFRRSDQVPSIVDEAITRHIPTIWMQLGVEHPEASARARAAGVAVFENLCIRTQHQRLTIGPAAPAGTPPARPP